MALSGPSLAMPVDVSRLLDKGLAGDPDDTALISLETSWTWRELSEDSARLAGNLLDLGLSPGDRAASLMPNRCALLVFYLACLKAGLVATPLNYRSTAAEIDRMLEASGASVLLAHRERAEDLAASPRVEALPYGIVGFGQGSLAGARFDDFIERDPETEDFPEIEPEAPALLLFVPTVEGGLKGIVHSRSGLGWSLASVAAGYALVPEDIFLTGTALSHYGAIVQCLSALASGARVAIARNADAEEILPLLRAEQPSLAFMPPSSMVRLVRDHEATAKDFASLRYLAAGGGQAPLSQVLEFERQTGVILYEHYGLVELGPITVQPQTEAERVTGAVGQLLPGFSAEIRGETGYLLPAGMPGRLWLRSPTALLGYWEEGTTRPGLNAEGWLDSTETMRADSSGTLILTSAKKYLLVKDLEGSIAREVEAVLGEHPSIAAAAIVTLHDLLHGETWLAFVVPAKGEEQAGEQELIAYARSRVGYKAPEQIVVLDALPLDSSGAPDRVALRRLAESGLSQDAPAD